MSMVTEIEPHKKVKIFNEVHIMLYNVIWVLVEKGMMQTKKEELQTY